MEVIQLPVLTDNYIYILICDDVVACVEPTVAEPVTDYLFDHGLGLDYILSTHHHWDHIGGNEDLKDRWGCKIIGAANDSARIPGIDIKLRNNDEFTIGASKFRVLEIPGHTIGHIAYYFPEDKKVFLGDTVFAMGCGKLFEGTPRQMMSSINKIKNLPPDTKMYCAHEYTKKNAEFALTVDPSNSKLQNRYKDVCAKRLKHIPTVPSFISEELDTNPFLRVDNKEIQKTINCLDKPAEDVFLKLRQMKDSF